MTNPFTSLKRVLIFGWKNFSREIGLSLVSIFVLVVTISLITSLFLIRGLSEEAISEVEDKADMTIDFEGIVSEERIMELEGEISEKFDIDKTDYISREEAKERFVESFGDRPVVMEALDEVGNPFPASLNIKAGDPDTYRAISEFANDSYPELIYGIDFYGRQAVVEGIFSITETLRSAGIIVSSLLALIAVLLVFNTVKLAIYGMKEEIRVMGLVGSSSMFIQGSFVTQGVITGIVSALLSFIVFLVALMLVPYTYMEVNVYKHLLESMPFVLIMQLSVGVILGVVSSVVAARKYLG